MTLSDERPRELLYSLPSYGVVGGISFRLDVDDIQPERVFVDDAIDAFVPALS